METIIIQVPDGCEVQIVKKNAPVIKTYQDIVYNRIPRNGYSITASSNIIPVSTGEFDIHDKNIAISEKVAKSMLAMAQISQLMPYYGGEVTKEEWENGYINKFIIYKVKNTIKICKGLIANHFLAFHTEKQRNEFLKYNTQLVKDYLMID